MTSTCTVGFPRESSRSAALITWIVDKTDVILTSDHLIDVCSEFEFMYLKFIYRKLQERSLRHFALIAV